MSERRLLRLLCLGILLAGVLGTVGVVAGVDMGDGSLTFPSAVGGGILGLSLLAPERRSARQPEADGPTPERGASRN